MNQPDSIGQTKTYWIVCEATPDYRSGDPTKEKWFERSGLTCTCEKDGQRKLRWLRQWHPNAFLAKATITPVPDKFKSPLPFRGRTDRAISEPQLPPAGKPRLCLV
jgi:hypothetical protein